MKSITSKAADLLDPIKALSVYDGATCIGFLMLRGPQGVEAFDAATRSLGVFPNQYATISCLHYHACRFSKGGEAGWAAPRWTQIAAIIAMQSRRKKSARDCQYFSTGSRVTFDPTVQSYDPASVVGRNGGEDAAGR